MLIIADSGSTKTNWFISVNNQNQTCITSGINPLYQNAGEILESLRKDFLPLTICNPVVYFYGAGCISPEVNETVLQALQTFFGPGEYYVDTDLMAAARSLCGHESGVVCIIGTGSNSCVYNGERITRHVSPLGYVLGDEGSGAVLGKLFISDLLKNQLPEQVRERFFTSFQLTSQQIIEQVYKKPFPNRFLATFTRFIHSNLDDLSIRNLVKRSFQDFFTRNVLQYPESNQLPVHFTGSIAWHFRELLEEAASESGCKTGLITAAPMEGLIKYHLLS